MISDVRISATRDRSLRLAQCFALQDTICYCTDISNLFVQMGQPFNPDDWRLFIDGSKTSIKAVLLHNGNVKPSIPVGFATGMREDYEVVKDMMNLIQYNRFDFKVVADFKMIAILMGLQGGNTSYPCFLCLWNSRAYESHFTRSVWPARKEFIIGRDNVVQEKIVRRKENIIVPPLHIKLGIMTQFVKAVGRQGNERAIDYLDAMFPKLSRSKVEEGVFVGPQIRKVMHSDAFKQYLTCDQKTAWESFEAVIDGFLGKHKSNNYRRIVAKMIEDFRKIGSHLPLKMHFLKSHLDYFPDNLGAFSDEQGERFHQDLSDMEDRFNNRYTPQMLGEYCWSVLRDTRALHKRVGTKRHF